MPRSAASRSHDQNGHGLGPIIVYLNDDPGLTLNNFTTRSNLVAYGAGVKSFNGKCLQQMTKLTQYLCF